jgi:hypothetical protein
MAENVPSTATSFPPSGTFSFLWAKIDSQPKEEIP